MRAGEGNGSNKRPTPYIATEKKCGLDRRGAAGNVFMVDAIGCRSEKQMPFSMRKTTHPSPSLNAFEAHLPQETTKCQKPSTLSTGSSHRILDLRLLKKWTIFRSPVPAVKKQSATISTRRLRLLSSWTSPQPDRCRAEHDDRYWFCLRVGCDQKHEEEMDSEAIYKKFVLRVMAARSPSVGLRKALCKRDSRYVHGNAFLSKLECPHTVPAKPSRSRVSKLAMISSIHKRWVKQK
ncbi:hypothetical protein GQ457_03G000240 [Hibiscus cannabinus]